ncbi:MAG TPA: VWA domain-containing protein [Bryobacteraceae bacterium]|jgi:VWFA-related protein
MNRLYIVSLLLIGCAADAEPQEPLSIAQAQSAIESPAPQPFQISVNVDLVVLQATVRDRNGRFVSDLHEKDFDVYEDGVRQSIRLFRHEDVPVTVGLVIDHSTSMSPKLTEVVTAARTFTRSSNPEDELFVVNFNEKVTLGLPAETRFTNDADALERAISRKPALGQTALYDATIKALGQLQTGGPEKKVLIVISDGGDNASVLHLPEVLREAALSSAVVYTIGIFDEEDPDRNPNVLRRLARATGGEAFFPSQLNEVVAICERIARDIRNQYTIGYISNGHAPPGAQRAIRMAAHAAGDGKLSVRTRSSYISPRDESVK